MPRPAAWLTTALALACANTAYLSWRYLAVRHGWAEPGTGWCSWTAHVDCDLVLQSKEARALWVPNALLGLSFFGPCLAGWLQACRRGAAARAWALDVLTVLLGFASVVTLGFLALMARLDALCPLCPWNHLLTWVAFGAALRARSRLPQGTPRTALRGTVACCAALGLAVLATWALASAR